MKKTKLVGSIGDFLNPQPKHEKTHWEKYGYVYKIVGTTVIILFAGGDYGFAAGGSLDESANRVYYKLVEVGKWIIIFKGGMETIKAAGGGDFESAKKSFFSYLIIYLLLLGLPYGFNEIDKLFAEIKTEA